MYTVRVRRHMMIAHSLPDPSFGPAARLHGATYVVDIEFCSEHLNAKNVVIDIGAADKSAKKVLDTLDFRNLDEEPQFAGKLTTTEFLAKHIHDEMSRLIASQFQGCLKVTLNESPVASASYEGPVSA